MQFPMITSYAFASMSILSQLWGDVALYEFVTNINENKTNTTIVNRVSQIHAIKHNEEQID